MFALAAAFADPLGAAEDPRDARAVQEVLQEVLETQKSGVEVPWSSSVTGNKGVIRVERTFFRNPDLPCRDYIRTVDDRAGGKITVRGTGCRVTARTWSLDEKAPEIEKPKAPEKRSVEKPETSTPPPEKVVSPPKEAGETVAAAETSETGGKTVENKAAAAPPPPPLEYSLPTSSDL